MNKRQFVNAVAELEGVEQPIIDFYMVICNGEIHSSFVSEDMAQGVVDRIDEDNTNSVIEESGREVEDLTDEEYGEMEVWGGFEGDHAYVENVYIDLPQDESKDESKDDYEDEYEDEYNDDDNEEYYETSESDSFSYDAIFKAYKGRESEEDILGCLDDAEDTIADADSDEIGAY